MTGSGPVQARVSMVASSSSRRTVMRPTRSLIALAIGAALPSTLCAERRVRPAGASAPGARRASARASRFDTGLPPRLQEDVRLVGALAELFARAAAERLMKADATTDVMRLLPLIALATGAALCAPMLGRQTILRTDRSNTGQRLPPVSPDHGDVGSSRRRVRGASSPRAPRGQEGVRVPRASGTRAPTATSSGSVSISGPGAS